MSVAAALDSGEKMNQKTVAMVDVYSPSMRLARAFMDRGYGVVRVQSTPEVPPVYRGAFDREDFVDNIVHEGDLHATAEAVAKHRPTAVLAGGELGVELADRISEELGLATNGTALSEARRNKFVQIEVLKAAGLRGARQLLVPGEEELAAWHRETEGRVVVKPLRSAGNDGVFFCDTPEDAVRAFRSILEQTTIFAERNRAAVAQEYLAGTEYVVNTVSRDGHHRATDLWKYIKMTANGDRDRQAGAHLVPADAPVRRELVDYAFAVLDALGIRHGPAHLEVMMTPEGPCLVEAGARICGADKAYYAMLAAGESQIEQTVDAYVDPEQFLARHQRPYRVQRHVGIAWLTSPVTGILRSYPLLDRVRELESFNNVSINVQPGGRLPLTVNDLTEPMTIGLAHPVAAVVERDFTTVCYLDGPGFYEVEPDS
jgi:biotin carboxylase